MVMMMMTSNANSWNVAVLISVTWWSLLSRRGREVSNVGTTGQMRQDEVGA